MSSLEADRFFAGTLVTWLRMILNYPQSLTCFWDLLDGRFLHDVYLKIDPTPINGGVMETDSDFCRQKNLEIVFENIKHFYETELDSVVLKVPNIEALIEDPSNHVEEMKILLTMLLGCAVQCSEKDQFISQITSANMNFQEDIMEHIKQVTQKHDYVLSKAYLDCLNKTEIFNIIRTLQNEIRLYNQMSRRETVISPSEYGSLALDRRSPGMPIDLDFSNTSRRSSSVYEPSQNGDSQLWKLRTELDKMKEAYLETVDELEDARRNLDKLQEENRRLFQEAKVGRSYRDKLDIFMEKSSKVDQLQKQISLLEQRASESEFLKVRVGELLEDNKHLQENYDTLYEQLTFHKSKAERVDLLEEELVKSRDLLENLSLHIDEFDCKSFDDEEFVANFGKPYPRLNETVNSEPDLIAGVCNQPEQNLFEELTYNQESENKSLSNKDENAQDAKGDNYIRSVTECRMHSKKIEKLKQRYKKFKRKFDELNKVCTKAVLEAQRLVEQMTQWQCKAVLYETRWVVQRCKKAKVLNKNSDEITKFNSLDGKFDFEGNFISNCQCETGIVETKTNDTEFIRMMAFWSAFALTSAIGLSKIFKV